MTIRQALKKYHKIEIDLLLSHVLGRPKEFLYMAPERKLSSYQVKSLSSMVKRRMAGEPVAYILGYKDFCGLRFKVNKSVLIPRPETEWVVEKIVTSDKLQVTNRDTRILDVGTGSGCIAISIAKHLKANTYKLTASDISLTALKVAKENAKAHKTKIKFIKSDLFKNIDGKFDVIVANLPYVPIRMLNKYVFKEKLEPSHPFSGLRFEPLSALTDGTNSFQIYRRFFEQVGGHLNPKSIIFLEIDPSSKKFINEYQKKYLPKAGITFHRDFRNLYRFAEISLK